MNLDGVKRCSQKRIPKIQQPYGFVCHETDMFVFMIDKNGNQFHKKKCAINNNPGATH